jgi:HEAT repeat protein
MTAAELRAKLSVIEPTERLYAGLAPADVPVLAQLLGDPEDWVAARAVFALSRIGDANAVRVIADAATDRRSAVRAAVAAAVGQRPIALPDRALVALLRDGDPAVRKFAPMALKRENGEEPRTLLRRLATDDHVPVVRENAVEALRHIRP